MVWRRHGKKQVEVVTRQLHHDKKQMESVTYGTHFLAGKLDAVTDAPLYDNWEL